MILLSDIGNTHVHLGLANAGRICKKGDISTRELLAGGLPQAIKRFVGTARLEGGAVCSVVPAATPVWRRAVKQLFGLPAWELSHKSARGIGIDYPKPETIGPDRLANAIAVKARYGAPSVVVDFGTAVTFDVVDRAGNYAGGIIAPGLAAMTDYLHERTALLPRIRVRETRAVIGKSTEEAMLVGAVHGYRGMIRELLRQLREVLKAQKLPVVATGGYARLIATRLPEITAVDETLTLDGLRLFALAVEPSWTGPARSSKRPRANRAAARSRRGALPS